MWKFGLIAALLFLVAATISVCGRPARADGDRIEPSIGPGFFMQVEAECKAKALERFNRRLERAWASNTSAPPPQVYSEHFSKYYSRVQECEQ